LNDCVPINLFGGTAAVTPAAAGYVVDNGKIARGRTTEDDVEINFRGNVTKGSGGALGPITAAFGLSWREEQLYVYTVDPCDEFPCTTADVPFTDLLQPNGVSLNPTGSRGIIAGVNLDGTVNPDGIPGLRYVPGGFRGDSNSSTVLFSSQRTTEGAYNVREGFFEFGIPLLKDGKLNLDEAYRRANYTGSGGVDAWKSGISYQATPKFRIRATRSQDVRAPTLQERFESQRGGVRVNDPANGGAPTDTASYQGGNPNVGLETALTDTIGIVYQPLNKLSLTIDSYDINLSGAIGLLGFQSIVNDCWDSAGHNSSPLCALVHRTGDPITGDINRVDNVYINLSNERVKGVDLELNYNGINVGRGMLSWRFLASRLDENSIQPPGGVRDERAGDVGALGLPKNKLTTSLRWSQGPVALFLQERYIGGGLMDHLYTQSSVRILGVPNTIDNNQVDSVLYTDLTFTYSGRSGKQPWEAFLTVNNLANTAPPDQYPGLGRVGVPGPNSFLYDTIGRRWTAGIRVNF
jgi:iron complex outermembrane receptor protein